MPSVQKSAITVAPVDVQECLTHTFMLVHPYVVGKRMRGGGFPLLPEVSGFQPYFI